MSAGPRTVAELFEFYHQVVKLLYSEVQLQNRLPEATLFEINAAFDHLSRLYVYNQPEADAVRHAMSHLKRSCLDIYRLQVKEARRHYDELLSVDVSIIDNGDFERQLIALWCQIREQAIEARRLEGEHIGEIDLAFERWQDVYDLCARLRIEFYQSAKVEWARRRTVRRSRFEYARDLFLSWLVGVITPGALWGWIVAGWTWLRQLLRLP